MFSQSESKSRFLRIGAEIFLFSAIGVILFQGLVNPVQNTYRESLANARNAEGIAHRDQGEIVAAIEDFRTAANLNPGVPDYHYNLSIIYALNPYVSMSVYEWSREELYARTINRSRLALNRAPKDLDIATAHATNYLLAEELGMDVEFDGAIDAWKYYLDLKRQQPQTRFCGLKGSEISILLTMARLHLARGDYDTARALAMESQALRPSSPRPQKLLWLVSRLSAQAEGVGSSDKDLGSVSQLDFQGLWDESADEAQDGSLASKTD